MSVKRAVVALSGGVDSAVAAAMLIEEGYEVVGVTLRMWPPEGQGESCSSAEQDAGEVASNLGIPHRVLDVRAEFARCVVGSFVQEYRCGRTPNPCVNCNPKIKFGSLLGYAADELGAELVATGHYARVEHDAERSLWKILKGVDPSKDQSYVLYRLAQSQLCRILMPLGYHTKARIRERAAELGLKAAADRPESQDICFVPEGTYQEFLMRSAPELAKRGPVLDASGKQLGEHDGVAFHTVGQRRGLGVAFGRRLYVTRIDAASNTIYVGEADELRRKSVLLRDVLLISGENLTQPVVVSAKIRYNTQDSTAIVRPLGNGMAELVFESEQRAVTPGQSAVFYKGEELLGGGTIVDEMACGDHGLGVEL